MSESRSGSEGGRGAADRFRTLPPAVAPDALRAEHDPEPVHGELDDDYREQTWMINNIG